MVEHARGSSLARISLPAAPRPGSGPGPPRRRNEIQPAMCFRMTSMLCVNITDFQFLSIGVSARLVSAPFIVLLFNWVDFMF